MNQRVKIEFQLNREDQQTYETESLWAEQVAPNEFRIVSSPFFVFGVSAEDIVFAKLESGTYKFDYVVRKGGHSTYRVFIQDGRTIQDEAFLTRWHQIRALGATFENASDHFVSVDIPPSVDLVKVYELLKQGESEGTWAFEEGNFEGAAI